jgi:hypothetical protein
MINLIKALNLVVGRKIATKDFSVGIKYSPSTIWNLVSYIDPKIYELPRRKDAKVRTRIFQADHYILEPKFNFKQVGAGFDYDYDTVKTYEEDLISSLKRGELPPIVVLKDTQGNFHWIDGVHRSEAAASLGITVLPALVGQLPQ